MSSFAVRTYTFDIEPHPDAHSLDVARPHGMLFQAVTKKGEFTSGQQAVYIPEQAVLPESVLRACGLWNEEDGKGMLGGSEGNIVKPVKLRGVTSQGLVLSIYDAAKLAGTGEPEDGEWMDALGITKYVPVIPEELSGDVYIADGLRSYTDIENAKKYPTLIPQHLYVVATEKLHGTCTIFTLVKTDDEWRFHISSKGIAKDGLAFEPASDNVYTRAAALIGAEQALRNILAWYESQGVDRLYEITLFGETLGVQDLKYGYNKADVGFKAFDMRINGRYLDYVEYAQHTVDEKIPTAPILYSGGFDAEKIWEAAQGKTTIMGDGASKRDIREGVVVRPENEGDYMHNNMGMGDRPILKFINDVHATRKGGTELQ